jgi:serine protease Do
VITSYNGRDVADNNQLRNAVASTAPGTSVALEVLRNGRSERLQATVGELNAKRASRADRGSSEGRGKYGMSVEPLTPETADQLNLPRGTKGVVVAEVDPDGVAADSNLQEGDVIEKVNGTAVTTVDALKSALDRNDGKPSVLLVNRRGTPVFLTLGAR